MDNLEIHPITLKTLKAGHPWITKDEFSERFPKKEKFLKIKNPGTNENLGFFIHDPKHPKVVARYWNNKRADFKGLLHERLNRAMQKRIKIKKHRDNIYLCFGESDELPGLFVQILERTLLIQYQAYFWEKNLDNIINFYLKNNQGFNISQVFTQMRIPGELKMPPQSYGAIENPTPVVNESGLKFKLNFAGNHDFGLYTDMAGIRNQIGNYFFHAQSILNLFSYTGSFSLMGLKLQKEITSVDLSRPYMTWLNENIELNQFDKSLHTSIISPCDKYLAKTQKKYDLIVCDPPSFSSNGKKKESAIQFYKNNLKLILNCLDNNGKAIIFLNTHNFPMGKFKKLVNDLVSCKIEKELTLCEDCPQKTNFPEGNYLKGLILSL